MKKVEKKNKSRKKSGTKLGQHFLISQKVLATILREAHLTTEDVVLEVGPGEGVLTKELLEKAGKVIAVEKDSELIEKLKERFKTEIKTDQLILVEGDIRDVVLSDYDLHDSAFKIVANIPYYITGEILRLFLGGVCKPERMILLMQKEVAERIARSKKESVLSLSVKAYGAPKYVETVPRGAFRPPPSVDSAVLKVADILPNRLRGLNEAFFFTLIKAGFAQKRKFLKGNLKKILGEEHILQAFSDLHLNENIRAEDVSFENWIDLGQALYEQE